MEKFLVGFKNEQEGLRMAGRMHSGHWEMEPQRVLVIRMGSMIALS